MCIYSCNFIDDGIELLSLLTSYHYDISKICLVFFSNHFTTSSKVDNLLEASKSIFIIAFYG